MPALVQDTVAVGIRAIGCSSLLCELEAEEMEEQEGKSQALPKEAFTKLLPPTKSHYPCHQGNPVMSPLRN